MVSKGDIVLFNHGKGVFFPAIVVSVHPKEKGEDKPPIALVSFCTGFHNPSESVPRVKYGRKDRQYILKDEPEVVKEKPVIVDLNTPEVQAQVQAHSDAEAKAKLAAAAWE